MANQPPTPEHLVTITDDQAQSIAIERLGDLRSFKWATKGYYSRVAIVESEQGKRVLKFGNSDKGYRKDAFAHDNFASQDVPIPEVFSIEQLDSGLWLGVYKFAPGQTCDELSETEAVATTGSVQQCLKMLHKTSVNPTSGWGELYADGTAPFPTLTEALSSDFIDQELYDDPAIDSSLIKSGWQKVTELLQYAPAERFLVHNDFGADNLLVDNGKVTAVLDWDFAFIGDWAMDIANLMKYPKTVYGDLRSFYGEGDFDCSHWDERINCYLIRGQIGLIDWIWERDQKGLASWQTLSEAQVDLQSLMD